jgi:hypothetical protein
MLLFVWPRSHPHFSISWGVGGLESPRCENCHISCQLTGLLQDFACTLLDLVELELVLSHYLPSSLSEFSTGISDLLSSINSILFMSKFCVLKLLREDVTVLYSIREENELKLYVGEFDVEWANHLHSVTAILMVSQMKVTRWYAVKSTGQPIHTHPPSNIQISLGRAIAQAVSHRLPIAAARVQTRVWSCGILWWTKVALEQVFSKKFGFPCQSTFHLLLYNHLHWHNRPGVATVPKASQTK